MRSLRGVVVALFAALVVGMAPTAAAAQPYPVVEVEITVNAGSVTVGTTITISGSGYLPFETIRLAITFNLTWPTPPAPLPANRAGLAELPAKVEIGSARANALGDFTAELPASQVGTATIIAAGVESRKVTTTTVLILAGGAAGGAVAEGGLPVTGADGGLLGRQVTLGAVALLIGTGLVVLSMRRRRRATDRD